MTSNGEEDRIPTAESPVSEGSEACTSNGRYGVAQLCAGPSPRDSSMVHLGAVSRRCSRSLNCGFDLDPLDLDSFCRRWLEVRKLLHPADSEALMSAKRAAEEIRVTVVALGG